MSTSELKKLKRIKKLISDSYDENFDENGEPYVDTVSGNLAEALEIIDDMI